MCEKVLLTSTLYDLLVRKFVIHKISWLSRLKRVESFSARMCRGLNLEEKSTNRSGCGIRVFQVFVYHVHDECFGISNPSACMVYELERVHQWDSYLDDVLLYDPLHEVIN